MKTSAQPTVPAVPGVRDVGRWRVCGYADVASTSAAAATLPPWSAVYARTQSAGRGRTGRTWVSNEGGLWLSAVLPTPGDAPWALLPLAGGWAVLTALRGLGVPDVRLRWPNDLMVGRRKLAGILVDRFSSDTAVVGVGLNVTNHPDAVDSALAGEVTRLADLVPELPTMAGLIERLLAALAAEHRRLAGGGVADLCRDLNQNWRHRRLQVSLASRPGALSGHFEGVDTTGNLLLYDAAGALHALPPHEVELLRETF